MKSCLDYFADFTKFIGALTSWLSSWALTLEIQSMKAAERTNITFTMTAIKSWGNIPTPSVNKEYMSEIMQLDNKKVLIEFSTHLEIPDSFLSGSKKHSRAARYALSKLTKNTGPEDLDIHNHQYLKSDKFTLVSLSHTKDLACAATATRDEIQSIGIDIELTHRAVKPGIEKFYRNSSDQIRDNLLLWSLKEAAFKAISPLYKGEKVLVLKDIVIRDESSFICFEYEGLLNHKIININNGEYLVTIAAL